VPETGFLSRFSPVDHERAPAFFHLKTSCPETWGEIFFLSILLMN
jgi:hypothetical protein